MFDRESAKGMRMNLNAELAQVFVEFGKKHGVTVNLGNCKFSALEMTFQLVLKTADMKAIESEAKRIWESYCNIYGLDKKDFGATYIYKKNTWDSGTKFTLCGLDIGKPKFCIKAKDPKGTEFGFPSEQVLRQLHPERWDKETRMVKVGMAS